jgi:hypothetical protein
MKDELDKYFYLLMHPEEKKKQEPLFIIPAVAVKVVTKDPFTRDESQALTRVRPLGSSILAYLLQPKYKMTLEAQEAQD